MCAEGYFLRGVLGRGGGLSEGRGVVMGGDSSCEPCPKGATCAPNSTTASLVLLPGYWRLSTRSDALYACAPEGDVSYSACAGGVAVS